MLEDLQAPRAGFFRGRAGQDSPRCGVNSIHAPKTQRRLTNPPTQLCPHGIRMKRRTGEALPNPGHSVPWNREPFSAQTPSLSPPGMPAGIWPEHGQSSSSFPPGSPAPAAQHTAASPVILAARQMAFLKLIFFFFFLARVGTF